MTSCQISLAAMRLFKSYFAYCFSFVFLKQEIWTEGTIKNNCGRPFKEESRNPPSSRAPRVSLAPKTPFPFPFKRLPRRLG